MSDGAVRDRSVTGAVATPAEAAPATVDLRLASGAAGAWAASLWALTASARPVLAVAGVALLIGAAGLRLGRRRAAPRVVGLVGCCIAVVLAPLAVRLHQAQHGDLVRLAVARTEVTAELRVSADPRLLAATGAAGAARVAVPARLTALWLAGRRTTVGGAVLVLAPAAGWRELLPGQRVRADARLAPPRPGDLLTATLSARGRPSLLGPPPWWQRSAARVRSGLQAAARALPDQERGLLPGLVDGDTSRLDPVLAERFRVAGLTHLVAVSGTNCSILVGTVALLLRRMRASPLTIALVGGLVLVAFVVVARPSPSVLRAAVMAGIALVALAGGRQRSAVPVLATSVIVLLLWQPTLAADLAFALSVSATLALFLIAPGWARGLRARGVPPGIAEGLAVAAAAHMVTAPIVVGISGRLSVVAIPANMLAEPVVAAATVLGVLAAAASCIWLPAAIVLAWLAGWPCRWLVWVAERFGSVPGASVPWPAGTSGGLLLAAFTVALLLVGRRGYARSLLAVALVVAVGVQIPIRAMVSAWPPRSWLLVACDIGQGDALVLPAGRGSAVVIDTGPEPLAVDRCLHGLGITRISLLVLTHDHLDHVGGIVGVLHGRIVDRVIDSPLLEPGGGHRLVQAALTGRSAAVSEAVVGTSIDVGRVHLDILGPRRSYRGTRSDPNNSSVVLRATVDGRRILLPGDAEVQAQDDLLAAGVDLRADVLKIAHHGSAYSDPAFLQTVRPALAVISVGRGNDYGHPSPLLLAELDRLGITARRTDLDGDIAVVQRDGQLASVLHRTRTGNALAPRPSSLQSALHATMARCRDPPLTWPG
jgi:competence protein ComEC